MKETYVPPYLKSNKVVRTPKNCYIPRFTPSKYKEGLNQYFSINNELPGYAPYETNNEAEMIQDLLDEHIKIHGFTFTYLIRTNNTLDEIYGESIGTTFKYAFDIEMIPEAPDLMLGVDTLNGGDGYSMTDVTNLHVSYRRLCKEIQKFNLPGRKYPRVGDLVAWTGMNVGNLMMIKYINDKQINFQKNRWMLYNLTCQVHNLGQETFNTGNPDIDFLNKFTRNYKNDNADNYAIRTESQEITCPEPNIWNINFQENVDE